ncbi:MAG: amidohydrolase [Thalassotalea sp.]
MKIKRTLATLLMVCTNNAIADTTIINNINGYSINNNQLEAFHAIQFTDDKIDKIYRKNDLVDQSKEIHVIDGKGKTLLPGLIDAHGHVLNYGLSLLNADLVGSKSEAEAVKRTLNYAQKTPNLTWVHGRGWNQVQWASNQFPTAKSLDQVFPNQAVWLKRVDGHAGWANSKAMALAGITASTQAPQGGDIIKDALGQPTGVFIDNAMDLIDSAIPELTHTQKKFALKKAMKSLVSMGLTSVHDAGIDSDNISLYKALAQNKEMPIRINAMLYLPSKNWQKTLQQGHYKSQDDMFAFNSVKIQADGALGSRGASLIEDYSDHAGHKGLLLHDNKSLTEYITTAMQAGFQVNTHAIGDNANKISLDLYQQLIKKTNSKSLRHRIEHAQILRLEDIPRFNQLGIIASMQATHATSDKNMAQDRIGKQRILGAYAWRKLLNANTIIAAGSDFPVESPNPFFGLHASITRQDKLNQPEGGWLPNEKMTRVESLKSFTIDAAYSGHQETLIGSLEKGKKADFILVDNDYFTMSEKNIWNMKVLTTWVNGQVVYSKH